MLLCEASPDTVIDCLENNIDNHTGLLDLFTAEKDNILLGRHYYTNILSCLERLLKIKDYSVRAIKLLFEFGDKIDECSIGNNPREYISQVFCAFCNVSALEIEEKIPAVMQGLCFLNWILNEVKDPLPSAIYNLTDRSTSGIPSVWDISGCRRCPFSSWR